GVDGAAAVIAELDDERVRLEAERSRLERAARDLAARREEHAAALAALAAIDLRSEIEGGGDPGGIADGAGVLPRGINVRSEIEGGGREVEPYDRARTALSRLAEREAVVARGAELELERAEAERLARRQVAARALAAALFAAPESTSRQRRTDAGATPPPSLIVIERSAGAGPGAGDLAAA